MNAIHDIIQHLNTGPQWVKYWVLFMAGVFTLSLLFISKRKDIRWISLSTLVLAPVIMAALYAHFGFERILGLGHILGWAPGLYYVWRHKNDWNIKETLAGKYLLLAVITMLISLVFDISDLLRFILGERV